MKNLIACSRDKFSEIWRAVNSETIQLELNEPILEYERDLKDTSPVLHHTLLGLKSISEKNITRLSTQFQ